MAAGEGGGAASDYANQWYKHVHESRPAFITFHVFLAPPAVSLRPDRRNSGSEVIGQQLIVFPDLQWAFSSPGSSSTMW